MTKRASEAEARCTAERIYRNHITAGLPHLKTFAQAAEALEETDA